MKYKYLIDAGKAHLEKYPGYEPVSHPSKIFHMGTTIFHVGATMFPMGAKWMYDRLNELDGDNIRPFDPRINYNFYGCLKYGACLSGAFLATWWLQRHGPLLMPLSMLLFYLIEIQFLFLFPLLIDNARHPILTGIREVFRIGVIKCLFTVIPISIFMMTGLLRKKDMFRNWYIGCLSILIWYNHEVRNRTSSSF